MLAGFTFKSAFRRLRRYRFLVSMIGLGIAAVTIVQSITVGMERNVIEGSARYLGGRYLVIQRRGLSTRNFIDEPERVLGALAKAGLSPRLAARREVAADNGPTLFFNGESFEVRRVTGVDFQAEAEVFSRISFPEGGIGDMPGSDGILLSAQIAERFGAKVGDRMTLRMYNQAGFLDSAPVTVQGVFSDASIFGFYNCYVDLGLLRRLLGDPAGSCSFLGLYFDGGEDPERLSAKLSAALAAAYPSFDRLQDKDDADVARSKDWAGSRAGVLPVERYIDSKVMDLIGAIRAVSYLFLALILAMILIGMRNTMRIMTIRRTKEIGSMRAMGLSRPRARRLVASESLIVASCGFVAGLAAAVAILLAIGAFHFEWAAGFDIFLRKNRLGWSLSPAFLAIDYAALALMTLAGSWPAARRAASIEPAAAISSNE